jgi:hypothetical protein
MDMRGNLLKKTISIREDLWDKIVDYQFEARLQSASRAVEKLLLDALKAIDQHKCQVVLIMVCNWYPADWICA